jgi:rSAM/selenodomain-associated transferase 1
MIDRGPRSSAGGEACGTPLRRLAVFFRNPVVGQVKTRLARRLGDERAAAAYRAMATELLANLEPIRDIVVPFFDSLPDQGRRPFGDLRGSPTPKEPAAACSGIRLQSGRDLGERMAGAFAELFAEGVAQVLLVGSDIPQIDSFLIAGYFQALEAHDAVIGPASDGGYYLIGFKRESFSPELFSGIRWSTEQVYRETVARAESLGLSLYSGRTLRDIDTYEDLASVIRQRNAEVYFYDLVRLFLQHKEA